MQFSAERVVIAVFPMIRFRVRVSSRSNVLKIRFCQRRFVLGQGAGARRPARAEEKDCDERREDGEGKVAKLSVGQGKIAGRVINKYSQPLASLFF